MFSWTGKYTHYTLIASLSFVVKMSRPSTASPHTEINQGGVHFVTHGLHVSNGVGYTLTAHGNFAMQIRLPTTSKYGNSVCAFA